MRNIIYKVLKIAILPIILKKKHYRAGIKILLLLLLIPWLPIMFLFGLIAVPLCLLYLILDFIDYEDKRID